MSAEIKLAFLLGYGIDILLIKLQYLFIYKRLGLNDQHLFC